MKELVLSFRCSCTALFSKAFEPLLFIFIFLGLGLKSAGLQFLFLLFILNDLLLVFLFVAFLVEAFVDGVLSDVVLQNLCLLLSVLFQILFAIGLLKNRRLVCLECVLERHWGARTGALDHRSSFLWHQLLRLLISFDWVLRLLLDARLASVHAGLLLPFLLPILFGPPALLLGFQVNFGLHSFTKE